MSSHQFNDRPPKFVPKSNRYQWRPIQKEQEYSSVEGTNYVARITPSGASMEGISVLQQRRLIHFLEKDDSFLSPWNWNPKAWKNGTSSNHSTKEKQYLRFQSGSYFVKEPLEALKPYESIRPNQLFQAGLAYFEMYDWLNGRDLMEATRQQGNVTRR